MVWFSQVRCQHLQDSQLAKLLLRPSSPKAFLKIPASYLEARFCHCVNGAVCATEQTLGVAEMEGR